jgi:hypothetical protein
MADLFRHSGFYLEAFLILGMLGSLFIPANLNPVAVWRNISPALYLRALFWLSGLLLLPGTYLLRLTGIRERLDRILSLVFAIEISFAFVAVLAIALYSTTGQLSLLPVLAFAITAILALFSWLMERSRQPQPNVPVLSLKSIRGLSKSQLLLLAGIVATVVIALLVQLDWLYLFPVDLWQTLRSATAIMSHGSVYDAYLVTNYPVAWGYIIAGLSTAAGFPLVNTYVLLTPVIALNILTFYALVKIVFGFDDKTAALASVIYGFAGGLGLWAQIFAYNGAGSFLDVSSATQDMYFTLYFWNGVEFSYKLLALTFALSSLIAFALSERFQRYRKVLLLFLCSLFMLFAFFIHELPALLAPVLIGMVLLAKKKSDAFRNLVVLGAIAVVSFFALDYSMEGIYTPIIFGEFSRILGVISTIHLLYIAIAGLCAVVGINIAYILVLVRRRKRLSTASPPGLPSEPPPSALRSALARLSKLKPLFVIALGVVYVAGIFFWTPVDTSLSYSVTFAYDHFVTRYGFLGILALIGIATTSWKESWFRLSVFWGLYAIVIGSIWWGERTNSYLFYPLVALSAAGIVSLWGKARSGQGMLRRFKGANRLLRVAVPVFLLALVIVSFASQVYGASWLITESAPAQYEKNNEVQAFAWIYDNTPQNSSFLVNYQNQDFLGIAGIAYRGLVLTSSLPPELPMEEMFTYFPYFVRAYSNISLSYIFNDPVTQQIPFVTWLSRYATTVFSLGGYSIQAIPDLAPPSNASNVLVLDQAPLGIQPYFNSFGWVDDSFTGGWTYANINASTDGQVLSLTKSSIQVSNMPDPTATCSVPNVNTSADPYLVIRYTMDPATSSVFSQSLFQIVTVNLSQGSNVTTESYGIPFTTGSYQSDIIQLPPDEFVENLTIRLLGLNTASGFYSLDIDYVGLASNQAYVSTDYVRFLSMAIPSLWPTQYTIASNIDALNGSGTVITTLFSNATDLVYQPAVNSLVLLNATASIPSWGDGWVRHSDGIMAGYLDGKKVVLVGVDSPQVVGNLTGVSSDVYGYIYG